MISSVLFPIIWFSSAGDAISGHAVRSIMKKRLPGGAVFRFFRAFLAGSIQQIPDSDIHPVLGFDVRRK